MTDENIKEESAMEKLVNDQDMESIGMTIAGVLEFLTTRAFHDGPFYIMTDDEKAVAVFATEADAETLKAALPEHFMSWDDQVAQAEEPEVLTNVDPGDEQNGETK